MDNKTEIPFYKGKRKVNPDYHHGQVPIMGGVACYQVARADRLDTSIADGTTSTYKHAPDIAYYHGRFYVMYLCNPKDEHGDAGFSMLVSSEDGRSFYDHREVFPEYRIPKCTLTDYKNITHEFTGDEYAFMHQRRCFYRAKNDCMLLLGFYGYSPERWMVNWDNYGIGRVARRLFPDGSLGDIFFILPNYQAGVTDELLNFPLYTESDDSEFAYAVNELLSDNLAMQSFAEENGDKHESIHVKHPEGGTYQAFCYYHIDDKRVAGLWKHSYVSVSSDGGETFPEPIKSPSLVMSGQKIWGERMSDGRFCLVYDPTLESTHRYPLCAVVSKDGIAFDNMKLVHGEVPPRRYGGFWKDFGPQYMRGIAEGLTTEEDHPDKRYVYVTYSVNKEDIWVAHIPAHGFEDETSPIIYKPYLSDICEVSREDGDSVWHGFSMKNREPYDYPKVIETFKEKDKKDVTVFIDEVQLQRNELYMELIDECQQSAVMMRVTKDGYLQIRTTAWVTVCEFIGGEISLSADCESNTVCVNGKSFQFYTSVNSLRGLTFRLGPTRRLPDRDTDSEIDEDLPYLGEATEDKATIFIRPMQS